MIKDNLHPDDAWAAAHLELLEKAAQAERDATALLTPADKKANPPTPQEIRYATMTAAKARRRQRALKAIKRLDHRVMAGDSRGPLREGVEVVIDHGERPVLRELLVGGFPVEPSRVSLWSRTFAPELGAVADVSRRAAELRGTPGRRSR